MTHVQRIALIEQIIDTLRPVIVKDGGNIEFVLLDEHNNVHVRLTGACVGCPSSIFTLKFGVEEALKQQLPDICDVILVA